VAVGVLNIARPGAALNETTTAAGCHGAIRHPIKDKSEQALDPPMDPALMWRSWVRRGPAACRFVELQRVGPRRSGERTMPGRAASDRDAVTECNGVATVHS